MGIEVHHACTRHLCEQTLRSSILDVHNGASVDVCQLKRFHILSLW